MKTNQGSIAVEAALIFPLIILIFCVLAVLFRVSIATANLKHIALVNSDFFSTSPETIADKVVLRLNASKQWFAGEGSLKLEGPSRIQKKVTVVAKSSMEYRLPFINLEPLIVHQAGVTLNWISEDENALSQDSVWSLTPISRGLAIQKHFGRNLPEYFPVISSFEAGKAVSIVSLDLTLKTYANAGETERLIRSEGQKLHDFKGGSEAGVNVSAGDITLKELWIVVPEGSISAAQENEISNAIQELTSKGIKVSLIEYQKKGATTNEEN